MDVGLRDMLCCQRLDLASSSVEDFWQHTVVGIFGDISQWRNVGAVNAADLASDICSLRTVPASHSYQETFGRHVH